MESLNTVITATYSYEDNWNREVYKGSNGRMYVMVQDVLHTMTNEGEPDYPVTNVEVIEKGDYTEYGDGGDISTDVTPRAYFKGLDLSAISPKAAEYIKKHILPEKDLDLLSIEDDYLIKVQSLISKHFPSAVRKETAQEENQYDKAIADLKGVADIMTTEAEKKPYLDAIKELEGVKAIMGSTESKEKGGSIYKMGDKIKMFSDEPELIITGINEWADKLPTYDLISEDASIVRNNISATKFKKGGSTSEKKAKAKVWSVMVRKTKDSYWEQVNREPMTESDALQLQKDYEKSGAKYYQLETQIDLPFKKGGGVELGTEEVRVLDSFKSLPTTDKKVFINTLVEAKNADGEYYYNHKVYNPYKKTTEYLGQFRNKKEAIESFNSYKPTGSTISAKGGDVKRKPKSILKKVKAGKYKRK